MTTARPASHQSYDRNHGDYVTCATDDLQFFCWRISEARLVKYS